MNLSNISGEIPGFYVLSIDKLANQLIQDDNDVIKLNLGKSEFSMSDIIGPQPVHAPTSIKLKLRFNPSKVNAVNISVDYYFFSISTIMLESVSSSR